MENPMGLSYDARLGFLLTRGLFMKKIVVAALLAFSAFAAWADQAVLERVSGQVSAVSGSQAVAASSGAVFKEGTTISTGSDGSALLRFEDGQAVALHSNTTFKIENYRFKNQVAAEDKSVFSLLKGAARVVSGLLGQRNPSAFQMRTPTATVGIRGTDFVVAYENPSAVSVIAGNVSLAGGSGSTLTLGVGQVGVVPTAGASATLSTLSSLPAGMQTAITNLSNLSIPAAGGAAAGAQGAGAAAAGGVSGVAIGAVAIGLGVAAVAAGGGDGAGGTSSTSTSTATSTQ